MHTLWERTLNVHCRTVDVIHKFSTATKPTSCEFWDGGHEKILVNGMYGSVFTTSASYNPAKESGFEVVFNDYERIPRSFFGLPMLCNKYMTMVLNADGKNRELGFPQLDKYIIKQDADALVNKTIAVYRYSPKIGYIYNTTAYDEEHRMFWWRRQK